MLLNDFYLIKEIIGKEHEAEIRFCVVPEHPIFAGHFPGQPVVPGVCMVQIAKELLAAQLNRALMLTDSAQMKFLRLLVPKEDQVLTYWLSWRHVPGGVALQASIQDGAETVFKMQSHFQILAQP